MNLCICFLAQALFWKQSGEFEISSWFGPSLVMSYFCSSSGSKCAHFVIHLHMKRS